jgi:putative nucleotidyltransferase with HDIG domain
VTLIAVLFTIFLITARLVIPYHIVIPYAFPLAAFSLTVVALFGPQLAMITSLPLALMTAFALPSAFDLTIYYLLASLLGVLALGRGRRVASFFWAGVVVAISGIGVVFAYRMTGSAAVPTDLVGLATLAGVSLLNGLATASLTILLQFFLAQLMGTTTSMQLMDLSRPDHPLLQKLLREAPGTYQHSLQVANLAEQAAERIGADPLLTRVGALYHDAGKLVNPYFYIENQAPGFSNPHDELAPDMSARAIIQHVPDGLVLAQKYHLPRRVMDFISEHHGTTATRYQYVKAVKAAGGDESQVNKDDYRYPGPRPQSPETAILMLADGCEARVRAERPKEEEDLRATIRAVIDERVNSGQLDDTSLTLQDLNEIVDSFSATLRGVYHPRILYPQLDQPATADVITQPTVYPERVKEVRKESEPALPAKTVDQ